MSSDKYIVLYDNLTDSLYIRIDNKPANGAYLDKNYIIVRSYNNNIIGITIESFKSRFNSSGWENEYIHKYFPDFNIKNLKELK